MVSDRDAATGFETLMNGAILDFKYAPWQGSSDGVIFYFHVVAVGSFQLSSSCCLVCAILICFTR